MDDRLRALWDFDDLDASEARLRTQLDEESSDEGRAEVLTQLARVAGLRGEFVAGDVLIDEAVALARDSQPASARIELERGRLRRSSGDEKAALQLFESAFSSALAAGQDFMAVDAAHMAALAAPDRDGFVDWTRRGIELAEERKAAAYWLGPLLNNLGWEHYEAGELEPALATFEHALAVRSGRRCAPSAAPRTRSRCSSERSTRPREGMRPTAGCTRSSPRSTQWWDATTTHMSRPG
jgi:tetratricopeptide (TPR) repeat protein